MNNNLFRIGSIVVLFAAGVCGCASLAPGDVAQPVPAACDAPLSEAFVNPLPGSHAISLFGPRGRRTHDGIDLKKSAGGGDTVVAARDGIVETARRCRGYGLTVVILHPDGSCTRYAHLKKLLVDEQQQVAAGQQIGIVGATGNATTPHLHYEILTALGRCVDPVSYLQTVAVAQSDRLNQQTAKAASQPAAAEGMKEGLPEEVTNNTDFCAWNRQWVSVDPSFSADRFERAAGLSAGEEFAKNIDIINAAELKNATKLLSEYAGADSEDAYKIYSPGRTKFIWNAGYPDPLKNDKDVLLFDNTANTCRHLLSVCPAFKAEKIFWLNDNKFMVIVRGEIDGAKGADGNCRYYQHTLYLYDLGKNAVARYLSPGLIGGARQNNERTLQSAATGIGSSSFAK